MAEEIKMSEAIKDVIAEETEHLDKVKVTISASDFLAKIGEVINEPVIHAMMEANEMTKQLVIIALSKLASNVLSDAMMEYGKETGVDFFKEDRE